MNNNPNQNWNVTCTISILAYVTNANGVRVLNTAPVSNNLPIVSAYSNEVNIFKITAQDPEGTPLTYSPATPLDMGGKNHVLVPNLTVNSTGWVTFNTVGVKDGYWCTQIKFSDGLSYAVVDFLIFIAPRPKVCSANCGNKGISNDHFMHVVVINIITRRCHMYCGYQLYFLYYYIQMYPCLAPLYCVPTHPT